jgi:hypothetical protein
MPRNAWPALPNNPRQPLLAVKVRVRRPHDLRRGLRRFDIHQFTLTDTWTPSARLMPRLPAVDEFRPERKSTALGGFHLVNAAAPAFQKLALRMTGHPQPPCVLRPEDITAFEGWRVHVEVAGQTQNVFLREVNEALLFTAFRTAGLALEPQSGHPLQRILRGLPAEVHA